MPVRARRTQRVPEVQQFQLERSHLGALVAPVQGRPAPVPVPGEFHRGPAECRVRPGEDARIHDLCHTAATILYEEGSDLKDIQPALRHTRLQTTVEVYTHFTKKTQLRTANVMDGALSRMNLVASK
ncbi:hypothetical protein DEF23_25665 [Marinitenerispora sediminis]|uniref:Tyr recombinase domain-containing protein n=1 Tax=Marinitenerispora sediminis TaxID=1931232 RepID=A0A368SXS8_9ACTN|nr:hypothetical protein DEF24_26920 [Marinitenerispora sediminis]RCV48066.1 hypothetical protein DEF23_25665 [Marinitenerispora sediminis]RCV57808.1 hypothetical protein DEF28_00895 [Marinitenerispora sediminis]